MISPVWFVVAFIVVAVLVIIKLANEKQAIAVKIMVIAFVFLVISASFVVIRNNLDVKSFDGIVTAGKVYFSWLGTVAKNVVQVSGYAVHQNWGVNVSNSTVK